MLVIDASVAVKFLVEEPGSTEAMSYLGSSRDLIAPDWIQVEVGHAMWRKAEMDLLSAENAIRNLARLPNFFDVLSPASTLVMPAYRLAFDLKQSLYDCLYLALALRENGQMFTADRKFWNAAKRAGYDRSVELLSWDSE